ncbi:MAG: PD40 domain-containing protein [Deltaproteobacteria bacterium]|nr:PD40 domain-containing protein [Deltaproteobacteria bacterium]
MTPDGQILYFASNRPGGLGGVDLWRAQRDGNGWTSPENLPDPINSTADEKQAVISPDGLWIYFASDRNGGMTEIFRVGVNPDGTFGSEAETVLTGYTGEPSFTQDGRLFFVHVEIHFDQGTWELIDSDIYCVEPVGHSLPCTQPRI